MKTIRFIVAALLFFSFALLNAQNRLPDSRKSSVHSYIYKISSDNLKKVHVKDQDFTDEMLGEYVTRYILEKDSFPKLPRGNYVIVKAVEDRLSFTCYTEDNLSYKMAPSQNVMLGLYDLQGNIISDAIVKYKGQKLPFDKKTQTYNYNRKNIKDESIIEINHKGVYHYIEVEKIGYYHTKYKKPFFKNIKWKSASYWRVLKDNITYIFYPDERPDYEKYDGFIVFSKPIYKPGETVKFKAHMKKKNGTPYNKPVDVKLYSYSNIGRIDTLLTTLKPYRPGMYEYQFNLSDSLNLQLDRDYWVGLQDKKWNSITQSFRYEEYELKSVRFTMETEKKNYLKNDSIKVRFNVSDENDLAVYDGHIEIVVVPEWFTKSHMKKQEMVFIPDTLWQHTFEIDGMPEKEIILPDSIFPPNVSLDFQIRATYLSADNEKRRQTKKLNYNPVDYIIDFSLSKGIVTVKELYQGKSQPVKAEIQLTTENGEIISVNSVVLPYSFPLPWISADIKVTTEHTSACFEDEIKASQLGYNFYRENDSVYLKVDNPANIPFWYTIRRMNKEIANGYTTTLDYSIKDKGKSGYSMQLSYWLGENSKIITGTLPFAEKNISMDISTPTTVYPGQTTNVQVAVTNKKGKPVKDVDITAYSFTSKFEKYSMPHLQIGGKLKQAKGFSDRALYQTDENLIINKTQKLEWDKWKQTLSLDTIAYYNFIYPSVWYQYQEATFDGSTLISPYIVVDGVLQGVQMLWIDERLYYFNEAQHLNLYMFPVTSGKHNLRFRTYDREVLVHNVYVQSGMKNIFSFNATNPYTRLQIDDDESLYIVSKLLDKEQWGKLTKKELGYLSSQLITVDNNFGFVNFPNLNQSLDLPAYIKAGNRYYYLNHTQRRNYNYALRANINTPVLVGPFPYRGQINGVGDIASVYADGELITHIEVEGGNNYTLYPNYQKIKDWSNQPFKNTFNWFKPYVNFNQSPITPSVIRQLHQAQITDVLTTRGGATAFGEKNKIKRGISCNLTLFKDPKIKPSLIYITPQATEQIENYQLYYGATTYFHSLPAGDVFLTLVFSDSTCYSKPITLHPGGHTYLQIDSIEYEKNNLLVEEAFSLFNRNVKKQKTKNPYIEKQSPKDSLLTVLVQDIYKPQNHEKGVVTGVVLDSDGESLIGANVRISGTTTGTITNWDGRFELPAKKGDNIEVLYIGYETQIIPYKEGADYRIVLKEQANSLNEVVVVGYGTTKKVSTTGAVTTVDSNYILEGPIPGVIRGMSTPQNSGSSQPLIVINGIPFEGAMDDLDPALISSINVLKDASATAIYGARGANGVIVIEMNGFGNKLVPNKPDEEEFTISAHQSSIRRNFHDDAFWQPRLKTNKKGEVSFEVTYPDDITRWNAYFIAIGNKKQTDQKQLSIRSFKTLTGRLSLPRFAIRGDSINGVGRITSHLKDTIQIQRNILIGQNLQKEEFKILSSHVDYVPVKALEGDSLSLTYSLEMENGYFDGEERSIPILEQGLLQTYGDFKVINDSSTHILNENPELGEVTLHAEASSLELFLREIDRVERYPYMCNEQIASKIKVLLSKKQIARIFGKDFKEDKKIKELISHLHKNKNDNGLWGWWNRDKTEFWISRHIVETLLEAKKEGYKVELDEQTIWLSFDTELKRGLSALNSTNPATLLIAKQGLLDRLIFLKQLNAPIEYKSYFDRIDKNLKDHTTLDKLKTMQAMSVIGLMDEIAIDSLMKYSHETMLGSLYWGEKEQGYLHPVYSRLLPYRNNTETTLIAYDILKKVGGYEKEMQQIQNYFFECRQDGFWQNTYQASRIIQTIMPDILENENQYTEVSMFLNNKKITDFPYTNKLQPDDSVRIRKEGTLPLFVTAYQQTWNKAPQPESSKGFTVQTHFVTNSDTISYLKAGIATQLQVTVQVRSNAEYVQIEVPIPAGCTYDSKRKGNYWKEIHREHFKEKVVIFCKQLTEGTHHFTIELLSRYSGYYSLNPAKAELMYFPTFYGNEEMKAVRIE